MITSGFIAQVDGKQWLITDQPLRLSEGIRGIFYLQSSLPALAPGFSLSEMIWFQPQGGTSGVSVGQVELINTEGLFDDWLSIPLANTQWTYIRTDKREWSSTGDFVASIRAILFGVGRPEVDGDRMIITLRPRHRYMREPAADEVFSEQDTTSPKLVDTLKPLVFGRARQVPAIMNRPNVQEYMAATNAVAIHRVQEGGNPQTPLWNPTQDGFELAASPSLKITCDASGPPTNAGPPVDLLADIGNFSSWSGGAPSGWQKADNPPLVSVSDASQAVRIQATGADQQQTSWLPLTGWANQINEHRRGRFEPDGNYTLDEALENQGDGRSATMELKSAYMTGDPSQASGRMVGDGAYTPPAGYKITAMEVRASFSSSAPSGTTLTVFTPLTYKYRASGAVRSVQISSGAAQELPLDEPLDSGFCSASVGGIYSVIFNIQSATITAQHFAVRYTYSAEFDPARLTTDADRLTVGARYMMRVTVRSGEAQLRWGTVANHNEALPISAPDPFGTYEGRLTEGVHEYEITAYAPRLALESSDGDITIDQIEIYELGVDTERKYRPLMEYLHTLAGEPASRVDGASLDAVAAFAGDPDLGWWVGDQTTREQIAVMLSHSLGAATWGGIDGRWRAATMLVPERPSGDYLEVVGSFSPARAVPDDAPDLRAGVKAAKNFYPLSDSELAGVTSTWTEDERQQVTADYRITRRPDSVSAEYQAAYPDALSGDPLPTALVDAEAAQWLADHMARVYEYPPWICTKTLPIRLEDFDLTRPGLMVWHQDDLDPLFRMGRWAQIQGRRITDNPLEMELTMRISDHPESFIP